VEKTSNIMAKKSVLIVDDDKDLCLMLSKYLSIHGYDTDSAFNGEDALSMVPSRNYDLIILDIMMPGLDGYGVCHRLKMHRKYNRVPILMLSAKDTEQDKIVGLQTGADSYIFKPFDTTALLNAVEETIERCRLAEEELGIKQEISFRFLSRFSYLEKVNELINQLFKRTNLGADEIWELKLALHEMGINAIEHGNKMDPGKTVRVKCTFFDDKVEFDVEDEGEGFSHENLPDPTTKDALQRERGRGIFLVSQVVDEINYINGGARVRLVKYFNRPAKLRAIQKHQNK
jgi:two-component system, OmpR family, response regulator